MVGVAFAAGDESLLVDEAVDVVVAAAAAGHAVACHALLQTYPVVCIVAFCKHPVDGTACPLMHATGCATANMEKFAVVTVNELFTASYVGINSNQVEPVVILFEKLKLFLYTAIRLQFAMPSSLHAKVMLFVVLIALVSKVVLSPVGSKAMTA